MKVLNIAFLILLIYNMEAWYEKECETKEMGKDEKKMGQKRFTVAISRQCLLLWSQCYAEFFKDDTMFDQN